MARVRPAVPQEVKKQLLHEAGSRCANPGCSTPRVHYHHIQEWAVYETHDVRHMVAVCPTCHDEIHHGLLSIEDAELYAWKSSQKSDKQFSQIYVAANQAPKLIIGGTNTILSKSGTRVFEISPTNELSFEIRIKELLKLNLKMTTLDGIPLVVIENGDVLYQLPDDLMLVDQTGHKRVTVKSSAQFLPKWVMEQLYQLGEVNEGEDIELLSLHVTSPGTLEVRGIWLHPNLAFVA